MARKNFVIFLLSFFSLLMGYEASSKEWVKSQLSDCELHNRYSQYEATVSWIGKCDGKFASGFGTAEWKYKINGKEVIHLYKGNLRKGYKHGHGQYDWPSGNSYVGEYKNGLEDGQGKHVWPGGNEFVGQFSKGRSLRGKMIYASRRIYTGEFVNGNRNGIGTLTWPDGTKYEGEFSNGFMSGTGVMISRSGLTYKGQFSKDRFHGRGVCINKEKSLETDCCWRYAKKIPCR